MSQKLELNPDTMLYCEELEKQLANMQDELDDAAKALSASFQRHSEHLGIHTDLFEEWVESAKLSLDRNATGSLANVRKNLLMISRKIAAYIISTGGDGSGNGVSSMGSMTRGRGTVYNKNEETAEFVISQNGNMTILPMHRPLPQKNVIWENPDCPGEGWCVLRDDAVIKCKGEDEITGAELKALYGEPVAVYYINDQPDFWPYCDKLIGAVEIENFTDDRGSNFAQARDAVAKAYGVSPAQVEEYMKRNKLTWHECPDKMTMLAVPTVIHAAFLHYGGVGMEKALKRVIKRFDSLNCRVVTTEAVFTGRRR